jgi:sugar phosphate permease
MVGYFGLPFVMSLYLQQVRGFSPLATGTVFLPMMLIGALLTPFSARLAEKLGGRTLIAAGLIFMAMGLVILAFVPSSTPVWILSALMTLVGLAGPFVSPPITAVLLNSVSMNQAGIASGVFNTSRQLGGALAVAVFGALLAQPGMFLQGVRSSLLLAASITVITTIISLRLKSSSNIAIINNEELKNL